jgi:membrane fusion protein (multidrug efflux system)
MLHKRTKRIALGVAAVALLVLAVLLASNRYISSQRERQRLETERKELKPPAPVSVEIASEPLTRMRTFTANLRPWIQADVPAEVQGRVLETFVEAGQKVKKGDPLVRLDDTRARIAHEAVLARHTEASRLLVEAERLQKSRVVSQTAYEAALAEVRVSRALLDEARDTLDRHTVRAPFSGVVNERLVDPGEAVNVNQPVARVVDLEKLRVYLHVGETDLSAFPSGKIIPVQLSSRRQGTLNAEVVFASRSADPSTRLFRIEAMLDNADLAVPGGIQGTVETEVEVFPDGPVVPAAAVRFSGNNATVMLDGREAAVQTPVRLGPEIDGRFPVLEGLKAGDKVLIQ